MTSTDVAAAFASATNERNPSAKFSAIGDTHKGRIVRVGEHTGKNDLNGSDEVSVTIDLETDDGAVTLWCRTHQNGSFSPNGITRAVADAVKEATGMAGLPAVGGTLAVRYESDGQPAKPGWSPPKNFRAQYQPPSAGAAGFQAAADSVAAQPTPSSDLF